MTQPSFWDPPVRGHRPTRFAPVNGKTATSRKASESGAASQDVKIWTAKQSALLQVIRNSRGIDDYELASVLKWPHGSVNSVRNSVMKELKTAGVNLHYFTDRYGNERITKRTRWVIKSERSL